MGVTFVLTWITHRFSSDRNIDSCVAKLGVKSIAIRSDLNSRAGVRQELNKHDFKSLFMVVKERHYSNTEIQELADIAYRNLTLTQGFAMDPLIEKCIIGKLRK